VIVPDQKVTTGAVFVWWCTVVIASVDNWNGGGCVTTDTLTLKSVRDQNEGFERG
jgi:hypothetical protein